jgi:beta-galactosidase
VIGWQIDNEFGDRDYGPQAQTAFQVWLEHKYATLEALNDAWGAVFWGHTYRDWAEVPVPLESSAPHNPGLALDFARFSSWAYSDFQARQLEVIRERCPGHFVTHNFMGFSYETLDYFELAQNLDFVSWDNYPRMWWNIQHQPGASGTALAHATMRGLKGKNFWVMEQQSGPGGWEQVVPAPKSGQIRLWAYQAIAHGADGIVFFRFRTARHRTILARPA